MARDYLLTILDEGTTPVFSVRFTDAAGVPIAASLLTGVWLTYYEQDRGEIINGWHRVPVLNTHGVTVDEDGQLVWVLAPQDLCILQDTLLEESHVILLEVQWVASGILRIMYDETIFRVRNLHKVGTVPMLAEAGLATDLILASVA